MFTTVLKTYFYILLSYIPFLLAFSFVFSLIYNVSSDSNDSTNSSNSTNSSSTEDEEFDHFGTLYASLIRKELKMEFPSLIDPFCIKGKSEKGLISLFAQFPLHEGEMDVLNSDLP